MDDLAASRIGTIPLTPAQYYQRILAEMGRAGIGSRVLAVSTLSSGLWSDDADQARYAQLNVIAAARGSSICRLFVLPEGEAEEFATAITRQEDAGIEARVASTRLLAHAPDLRDFVLFEDQNGPRAYVAQPSIDGSRRIRCGTLVVAEHALARMRHTFLDAWELAATRQALFEGRPLGDDRPTPVAPGRLLPVHRLAAPVITCEEAAQARGVSLERELKTLLLQTHHGMVAAHLPGDGSLSLRKVKGRIESAEAYLADPEDLLELGLSAGTVSAVLEPVWSMPHLVSRRVLSIDSVTTNNGTRTAYFEFPPAVLLEAADVIVDDFEK